MTKIKNLLLTGIGLLALCSCRPGKCPLNSDKCAPSDCTVKAQCDSAAVINTILARRSVRKYKPEPVRRDQMDIILKCGINAPSGMNKQPWAVRVVDNPEFINGITALWLKEQGEERAAKAQSEEGFRNMFRNAPTIVFIASPANGSGQLDCGLLGENMMLAAQVMGIGSCCLGSPVAFMKNPAAADYVKQLQLPEDYQLLYAIGMGYPDEAPEAKPRDASKAIYIE